MHFITSATVGAMTNVTSFVEGLPLHSGLTFCNLLTKLLRFIKRPLVYCNYFFLKIIFGD